MDAVIISIRQRWCGLIATGEKTIEVRKTKPKLNTPFKVYIYCTKSAKKTRIDWLDQALGGGMVIGEFVCDRVFQYASDLFRSAPVEGADISTEDMVKCSCLTAKELYEYEHSAEPKENCIYLVGLYGWHITDVKMYDKPKPLQSFNRPCPYKLPDGTRMEVPCPCDKYSWGFDEGTGKSYCMRRLERPPQSWCYVEDKA